MKKTTKFRYCQIPKGSVAEELTFRGKALKESQLLDIFEDRVNNPFVSQIMNELGMLRSCNVIDEEGNAKSVYVVTMMELGQYFDPDEVMETVRKVSEETSIQKLNEIFLTIMGVQYIFRQKANFEVDTVILDGNTVEEIKSFKDSKKLAKKLDNSSKSSNESPEGTKKPFLKFIDDDFRKGTRR